MTIFAFDNHFTKKMTNLLVDVFGTLCVEKFNQVSRCTK